MPNYSSQLAEHWKIWPKKYPQNSDNITAASALSRQYYCCIGAVSTMLMLHQQCLRQNFRGISAEPNPFQNRRYLKNKYFKHIQSQHYWKSNKKCSLNFKCCTIAVSYAADALTFSNIFAKKIVLASKSVAHVERSRNNRGQNVSCYCSVSYKLNCSP
jgi:hypothetical protein